MAGRGLSRTAVLALALLALALTAVPAAAGRATYGSQRDVPAKCEGANDRITSKNIRRARAAVLCLINDLRRNARARPLRTSSKLTKASVAHSRDMTRRKFFAHVGPGGPSIAKRLRKVRYRRSKIAENIGFVANATPVDMLNVWIGSRPHLRNMTSSRWRYAGVGIVAKAPRRGVSRRARVATFTLKLGRYK